LVPSVKKPQKYALIIGFSHYWAAGEDGPA
jgi:hypothetical protein